MKDAFYFSHDSNARHDYKIIEMRVDYGWTGYGLYWAIIEYLRDQDEYKLPIDKMKVLAYALQYPEVDKFVQDCIDTYKLFSTDGTFFWSESLTRRMSYKEKINERNKINGKKGGRPSTKAEPEKQEEESIVPEKALEETLVEPNQNPEETQTEPKQNPPGNPDESPKETQKNPIKQTNKRNKMKKRNNSNESKDSTFQELKLYLSGQKNYVLEYSDEVLTQFAERFDKYDLDFGFVDFLVEKMLLREKIKNPSGYFRKAMLEYDNLIDEWLCSKAIKLAPPRAPPPKSCEDCDQPLFYLDRFSVWCKNCNAIWELNREMETWQKSVDKLLTPEEIDQRLLSWRKKTGKKE